LNLRVLADRMEGDNQTVTDIGIDLGALRGDWRHAHRECRALAYP